MIACRIHGRPGGWQLLAANRGHRRGGGALADRCAPTALVHVLGGTHVRHVHQLVQVVAFLVRLVASLGTKPLTVARVTSTHPDQPVHVLPSTQIAGHPTSGTDADRATRAGELLRAAAFYRPVRDAIRDVPGSTIPPFRLQACPAGRGPSGGLGHLGTFSGTSRCCRRAMSTSCTSPCRGTCLAGSGCADGRRR